MPNHLNTSDLFSSNPGELLQRGSTRGEYQSDSAINSSQSFSSASQVMASQMENSQSSSFDLFSQMMSQQQGFSQQNETTSSKFYMKYMSKPPLFQKETTTSKKPTLTRRKSFQEMQEFNREKAKERDDRDLINTFIAIVKECADEVKHAASSIRKDVDTNIADTTQQTAAVISKITEELSQYHRQLLNNLKTREDQDEKVKELTEIIATKDAHIKVLESQLAAARQDRDEHLLKAMLDMYTEQQSVTRQHLEKVHEEQKGIKEQQNKLLEETEKSHATLSRVTAMNQSITRSNFHHTTQSNVQPVTTQSVMAVGSHKANHPGLLGDDITSSFTSRSAFPRSRHLSGSAAWNRDDASSSRMMPVHAESHKTPNPISQDHQACPNPEGVSAYYNASHPMSYARFDPSGNGGHHPGQPASVASGLETRSIGLKSSTSHLFQEKTPAPFHQQHVNQDLLSPSNSYVMQKFLQQEVTYRVSTPPDDRRTSANPPTTHHHQQQRSTQNQIQAVQDFPNNTLNTTRSRQRSSSYDKFANKFSSPNYTSDKQLWSKKRQKLSPVAAVVPQVHRESSDDVETSPETQAPPARGRKQDTRRPKSKTHVGRRKQVRKRKKGAATPQRKSSRLMSKNTQEIEIEDSHQAVGRTKSGSSKTKPNESKGKSKSYQRSTSHSATRASIEDETQEEFTDDSASASQGSQASPAWDKCTTAKKSASKTLPQKQTKKASHSTGYSASSAVHHSKHDQRQFHASRDQDHSSDSEDEYSFHDEQEEPPEKSSIKKKGEAQGFRRTLTSDRNTTTEVFTKKSISTYSKRLTPLQKMPVESSGRRKGKSTETKNKSEKDFRRQTSKKSSGPTVEEETPKPVVLDMASAFSDDDDSSQEICFALKLPEKSDVAAKQSAESSFWSGLMSPSVGSHVSEQVVPNPDPRDSRARKGTSNTNNQGLKMNRKRRMIFSPQEDLSRTVLQIIPSNKQRRFNLPVKN